MSQLPVRRIGNDQDFGIGPNGEFFVKEQVRTMSGRPVQFPEGILQSSFGIYDADAFGAAANGVANDSTAINNAITAAWLRGGGVARLTPGRTYFLSSRIDMLAGVRLVGYGATILHDGQPFRANAFTGGAIEGVTFRQVGLSGQPLVQSCVNFVIEGCKFENQRASLAITGTSSRCRVAFCEFTNGLSTAVELNGAGVTGNDVLFNQFTNNTGFGVWITGGANKNLVEGNRTTQNGIELVGITYESPQNRVIANHAEGCGDNGISISSQFNVLTGNVTNGNAFHGLALYGSRNTVAGHIAKNNGTAGGGYAGLAITGAFGGTASYNSIVGGWLDDDQATPTQAYCWKINAANYTAHGSGQSVTVGIYRTAADKLYRATTAGTTGATPLTHTSGTASDGAVTWQYIDTFPNTSEEAGGNKIVGVGLGRFLTAQTLDATLERGLELEGRTHPGFLAGKQYSLWQGAIQNAVIPAVDIIYFYPIYIPLTLVFTSGAIRVATGGAGSSVKIGIWRNSPVSGRPLGAPVAVDNTGAATTGTGQIAIAIAATLTPGWYWVGTKTTGTPCTPVATNGILGFNVPQGSTVSAGLISFGDAYANAMPTLAEGASFTMLTGGAPVLAVNT